MVVNLVEEKQRLYSRLFVSQMDLSSASFSLAMLLKKGWHGKPWERPGSIYAQQTAYVTALVIAYARPFNKSLGWPRFPSELMPFTNEERHLHDRLITMRNTVVAHSDSSVYSIQPWRSGKLSADIIGVPDILISALDCGLLRTMIQKLQTAIKAKLKELVP